MSQYHDPLFLQKLLYQVEDPVTSY